MEKNLEIKIKVANEAAWEFDVEIYDPESGDFTRINTVYSPDEHPEFNERIGDEIYFWIKSMMGDE